MPSLPPETLTGVLLPLIAVAVLALLFSVIYARCYQRKRDAECSTTVVIVLSLSVALLTLAFIPVDIFTVSSFKHFNGTFQSWATNGSRKSVQDVFMYSYYTIYGLVMAFSFLILPFVYFYYEEKDEDTSTGKRICSTLKYWIMFVVIAAVFMIIGAFVPWATGESSRNTSKSVLGEAKLFLGSLESNSGENAVSFTVSFLVLIGMVCVALYTAVGMAVLPVDLIKGYRRVAEESEELMKTKKRHHVRRDHLRNRYADGKKMAKRDCRSKEYLEAQDRLLKKREKQLQRVSKGWLEKCRKCWRPFTVVIGIVLFLLAVLVFLSLLLSNIDRIMHGLGYHYGFLLKKSTLPSPIGELLLITQPFFPLDYVIMVIVTVYLVVATIYGIRRIGIWCFCMRLYRIRPRRTATQGLMFMSFIVMLSVFSLSVVLTSLAPDYIRYGHQKYNTNCTFTANNQTCVPCHGYCTLKMQERLCHPNDCVQTRIAVLVSRFCYKMWFFGVGYYACEWAFLGVYLLAFIVVLCRKSHSNVRDYVTSSDSESSSEEV